MEGRLRLLSGKPGDEDVLWPLGDIQEAILYYQVRSRPDTLQLTVNGGSRQRRNRQYPTIKV